MKIYTDGAYSSSCKQGGWSFVVISKNDNIICKNCGGVKNTTNNRMEMLAVLNALKFIKHFKKEPVTIYSDSMYVIGTLTRNWTKNYNLDLWEEFNKYDLDNIKFEHVKGHSINLYNNMCDEMAVVCSKINIL